jgi:excinuclease UvrABC nuclease subunit
MKKSPEAEKSAQLSTFPAEMELRDNRELSVSSPVSTHNRVFDQDEPQQQSWRRFDLVKLTAMNSAVQISFAIQVI